MASIALVLSHTTWKGLRSIYGFYPVEYLTWAADEPKLPDDLDNGYIVLLDKDHLTDGLMPPTFSAFQPSPPTEREYRAFIDEFFNDADLCCKTPVA